MGRWKPKLRTAVYNGGMGKYTLVRAGLSSCWVSVVAFLLVAPLQGAGEASRVVHHRLEVAIDPAARSLSVRDELTVPVSLAKKEQPVVFSLHPALRLESEDSGYRISRLGDGDRDGNASPAASRYEIRPASGAWPEEISVRVRYTGVIHHDLESEGQEYSRSFESTPGIIDERGVVLSGASYWLPVFGDELASFEMEVDLPAEWDAVSQGARTRHEVVDQKRVVAWDCPDPMDEIYLVAGPFTEYSRQAGSVTAYAFLRQPDPNLAAKYLEATAQYVEMYSKLLGPYPYAKFALVENFWETGYGMPSFTLLGSQVIRLPFILTSSYPHEILHNWWGNSVFVDYEKGNWCEGLTAYLADHLFREGQGRGDEYRRDVLQKYVNFVKDERDFPLRDFRSRHSAATEAVGYGKSLMLWHMLRLKLGDDRFVRALRYFYRTHRFAGRASFDDLQEVFSQFANEDLSALFTQWVDRAGAPSLEIVEAETKSVADGYQVHVTLRQNKSGAPYRLAVPIAFAVEGASQSEIHTVDLSSDEASFDLQLSGRPLAIQVDPAFDLFRKLDQREIPSSLGQVFGARKVAIVLPQNDTIATEDWRTFAQGWAEGSDGQVTVVDQGSLEELPRDSAVWILGASNRWADGLTPVLRELGAGLSDKSIQFGLEQVKRAGGSFVFTATHPGNPELAVGWIGADSAQALPGLARKLPHYGKYSYLAFEGGEPTNTVKGQWPALGSPLVRTLSGAKGAVAFPPMPPRDPLARVEPVFDPEVLLNHVRILSSAEMEGRGLGTPGIERAATYIASQFQSIGLEPGGDDGTYFQSWSEDAPDGRSLTLKNIIGVIPGRRPEWNRQSVVVGAHYDHLGYGWPDFRAGQLGKLHPGADDNASGVAVLLEVARLLKSQLEPGRGLVFVAFTAEEWDLRGSRHYLAEMKKWPASETLAMINLDSVGRLGEKKITVLGSGSADEWSHIAQGIGFTTGVESTPVADDPGGSDQKSFFAAGIPAVQIFAGAHPDYHWPTDTVDKIDANGLVKVAVFVREAAAYLSERERPLTSRLASPVTVSNAPAPTAGGGSPSGRRVSLGTLPDFTYTGPGVKVSQVIPGTAAEQAGMLANDLILAINGLKVADLRSYAEVLRSLSPGDSIQILVKRGEEELTLQATVKAR